jgi:hypothetical protein
MVDGDDAQQLGQFLAIRPIRLGLRHPASDSLFTDQSAGIPTGF